MVRKGKTRMVGVALTALLTLAFPAAGSAQNGFPAPKAAVDQYEPPPQQGGGQPGAGAGAGAGQGQGGRPASRPGRGGEAGGSRGDRDRGERRGTRDRSGLGGVGNDGGVGGIRDERGGTLPFAGAKGGKLPFTGLDLLMLSSLGALLLAGGFGLRAAARLRPR